VKGERNAMNSRNLPRIENMLQTVVIFQISGGQYLCSDVPLLAAPTRLPHGRATILTPERDRLTGLKRA
jgi:hypothetical protein